MPAKFLSISVLRGVLSSTRMAGTPTWRSQEFMLPLAEYGKGLRCPPGEAEGDGQ